MEQLTLDSAAVSLHRNHGLMNAISSLEPKNRAWIVNPKGYEKF